MPVRALSSFTSAEPHSLLIIDSRVEVITKPKHKDIDVQQVVDLRHIFTAAGYDTVVKDMEAKGKED